MYPFLCFCQFDKKNGGADNIGDHCGCGNSVHIHSKDDYKKEIQKHIQYTAAEQGQKRCPGIAGTAENSSLKIKRERSQAIPEDKYGYTKVHMEKHLPEH